MGCFIGFSRVVFLVFSSLLVCLTEKAVAGRGINPWDAAIKLPTATEKENSIHSKVGTRWAVLVAGSSGYGNYRHQADVCHAYQLLRKGGLKEKNIIVFMYDDIANSEFNPRPGTIINKPNGKDVYAGVPKDYTGEEVNTKNLYAVLLGNESAVEGGSGKVVKSKANDRIFIYYSDHGGPGVLGMPNMVFLYAADFIEVLKKKHEAGSYKEMVIYVEACESGSIFEGLLPDDLNIYVTTASNAEESSFGTYCPGMDPPPPPEFQTCLGDLYSVSWMEDSETHNLKKETLQDQFEKVKDRTSNHKTYNIGSHVMEYGNTTVKEQKLYLYQGSDPANENITENELPHYSQLEAVNQRDADLLFLWQRYKTAVDGSEKKAAIFKEIADVIAHRMHLDRSVDLVGNLLFGTVTGPSIIKTVRPSGQPLVDDWDCLKAMVQLFVSHCGPLNQYGMKHMRAFANVCNQGTPREVIEKACAEACSSSLSLGAGGPVGRNLGA